ncbi:MAG: hypothetical protein Q8R32_01045, partial [bacterium]|nr:hypothetical protein [bacterium]
RIIKEREQGTGTPLRPPHSAEAPRGEPGFAGQDGEQGVGSWESGKTDPTLTDEPTDLASPPA